MAWTKITAGEPELTFSDEGILEWNTALQVLLGSPEWVDLLWEPDDRKLGLRCNYISEGFPVYAELDQGEFQIDSAEALGKAGVSVEETFADTPVRMPAPLVGFEGALYSSEPVWYITIPE